MVYECKEASNSKLVWTTMDTKVPIKMMEGDGEVTLSQIFTIIKSLVFESTKFNVHFLD